MWVKKRVKEGINKRTIHFDKEITDAFVKEHAVLILLRRNENGNDKTENYTWAKSK
jgi:hypothetical protein